MRNPPSPANWVTLLAAYYSVSGMGPSVKVIDRRRKRGEERRKCCHNEIRVFSRLPDWPPHATHSTSIPCRLSVLALLIRCHRWHRSCELKCNDSKRGSENGTPMAVA